MAPCKKNIVFFHPDLGIGGAERLIIDAAVGLQDLGHKVTIFTSHCDPTHCFDEARDGTLDVRVRGNSLVPSTLLGRFWILCAILRQSHLILQITTLSTELNQLHPDLFFLDQLSAGIPLLRLLRPSVRVLFYCHFPDKLLASRGSFIKQIYRWPFDWLESWSTGCSDAIVVNSKFTRRVFSDAFPRLRDRVPGVVYPCVDTTNIKERAKGPLWKGKNVFLSINRFERKKDVGLAIRAFAGLAEQERHGSRLVVAGTERVSSFYDLTTDSCTGGYDPRNAENISYHHELEALADALHLSHATVRTAPTALAVPSNIAVLFLLSVPSAFKEALLASATLLLYTPRNEHFGIVPLEAMLAGMPVLAANEGGPVETVVDGETGWLRDARDVNAWTGIMREVGATSPTKLKEMGQAGRRRVQENFSKEQMARTLDHEMATIVTTRPVVSKLTLFALLIAVLAAALGLRKMISGDSGHPDSQI